MSRSDGTPRSAAETLRSPGRPPPPPSSGRTAAPTAPRRYTKIWIDVVVHEARITKNQEILKKMIHEKIHSNDYLEDSEPDLDEHSVEEWVGEVVEVIDIPNFVWTAERTLIVSLPIWLPVEDFEDFLQAD